MENLTEEEREEFIAKLIYDSEKMKKRFTILVARTEQNLKRQKTTVDELILIFENLFDENNVPEELEKETDLCKSLIKISKYWSFFDYEILSAIIRGYCNEDESLLNLLDAYESEFEHYCERRLCEVPSGVFNAELSGEKHTYHHVKLDDLFTVQLKDIKKISTRLSDMLQTKIRLLEIKDGCIELIYICLHEFNKISLSRQQEDELRQIGVLKIHSEQVYYEYEEATIMPEAKRGECMYT